MVGSGILKHQACSPPALAGAQNGSEGVEQVLDSSSCDVSCAGLPALLDRAGQSMPTGITAQ